MVSLHCKWPAAAECYIPSQLRFAANWKMSTWLAAAFSDWFGVRLMFDTLCPSRDDPLKEYSMLFPSKLNTQEFIFCAMKKYWSVHLSWNTRRSPSVFLCFNTTISILTRSTEKHTHICQSPLNAPDRATTISLNAPDRATTISRLIVWSNGMNDRQIYIYIILWIANQYPQFHRAFKRPLLGDSVGVVDGMPRAGSHYNLGMSRGPDNVGSRAGSGPRAVSCTWLL